MNSLVKKNNMEFFIGFFSVGGISFIMQLFFYFQGYNNSTVIVLSLNILLLLLVIYYIACYKPHFVQNNIFWMFVCFWILWYIRLFYDAFVDIVPLRLPIIKYYAFSVFSVIVPFFYGNFLKSDKSINNLLKGIVVGLLLFSIVAFIFFRHIQDHRVGEEDGSVTPLTISYSAAMIIAYFGWRIIENFRIIYFIPIIIGLVLLGLSASKGPVIALLSSLLFVLMVIKKFNYKIFILFILSFSIIQYTDLFSFDVLMGRFETSLNKNFTGSEKELRYYLWQYAINKFVNNPFLGYSLDIRGNETFFLSGNTYPHNIILEALLNTGIIGGVLLLTIIVITIKNAIIICKKEKENSWILLFLLLSIFQNMVSGSICDAVWFWFFVGLVNGRYAFLRKKENTYKI